LNVRNNDLKTFYEGCILIQVFLEVSNSEVDLSEKAVYELKTLEAKEH